MNVAVSAVRDEVVLALRHSGKSDSAECSTPRARSATLHTVGIALIVPHPSRLMTVLVQKTGPIRKSSRSSTGTPVSRWPHAKGNYGIIAQCPMKQ